MHDLERLFRHLVASLAELDPARLNRPVTLGEIRDSILPYRASRRALGLDTVEDYDLLLMRLAAGEGGFARTAPEDVGDRFAAEAAGSNPDLRLVEHHADVRLTLEGLRVARALAATDEDPYAPPGSHGPELHAEPAVEDDAEVLDLDVAQPLPPAPARAPSRPALADSPLFCLYCGTTLPTGRTVNFCPSCGQSQTTPRCTQCQSEVELGWRHCVTCGAALPGV
jgi:hypothetical protein